MLLTSKEKRSLLLMNGERTAPMAQNIGILQNTSDSYISPYAVELLDTKLRRTQAGICPYYRDSYYNLEPFRSEYKERYGKAPFVQKAMHWQW